MRLLLALSILIGLLFERLEGACPSIQKFSGTAANSCAIGNQGTFNEFTCTQDIYGFTLSGWIKLTANDSIIADTGKSDTYFALTSSLDSFKRFVLKYTFANPIGTIISFSS